MKRLLLCLLALCAGCNSDPVTPAIPAAPAVKVITEYPVNPQRWSVFERTNFENAVKPLPNAGIKFDFPISAMPDPNAGGTGWVDRLLYQPLKPNQAIKGTHIVYVFQIVASPGALFNYKSDPNNLNGPNPASLYPYIHTGMWDTVPEINRWWCGPKAFQIQNTGDWVTLDAPLDPALWSDVYAHVATESQYYLDGFNNTLSNPSFIGLSYGGGYFKGHGVNVSAGTLQFKLRRMYTY